MKKILLILISLTLTAALVACNNYTSETPQEDYQSTEQSSEQTEDWEVALVEYLAQFTPIFHNVRYIETEWGSWWSSDWEDFVEWVDVFDGRGYGYSYIFRDPVTGERLMIDDTLFLNFLSGEWLDEETGESQIWSRSEIATGFDLFDFDGSGIPHLIIYWSSPNDEIAQSLTLHRFRNGTFEVGEDLEASMGASFLRSVYGDRLLISYGSTVASWIDIRLLHLNDEITTEPVLSTDGWTGMVHNHLTGEYFGRDEPWGWFAGIYDGDSWEEILDTLLGFLVTRIEPMSEMQARITELVSSRF